MGRKEENLEWRKKGSGVGAMIAGRDREEDETPKRTDEEKVEEGKWVKEKGGNLGGRRVGRILLSSVFIVFSALKKKSDFLLLPYREDVFAVCRRRYDGGTLLLLHTVCVSSPSADTERS